MLSKEKNRIARLLIFPALIGLVSCGTDSESAMEKTQRDSLNRATEQHRIDSVKRKNPLLIVPPDSNYTGSYIDRYDNGIVKFRGFFRQGERHGQWMSFYPNGQAWSEMHYDKGRREGPNITYYEDGKIRYSGRYKNDVRDSIWVYYDTLGKIAERAVYKNDQIIRKLGPAPKN